MSKSIKIKPLIFEESKPKIEKSSIFEIFEDIVTEIELKTQNLQVVRPLFEYRKDLYLLQVSLNGGTILLDIFFDTKYLESDQGVIEVRPAKPEIGQMPDEKIFFYSSVEDLKEQSLNFIFSMFEKHTKTELLGRETHDFISEFNNVYKEVFKKHGFKIIEADQLVDRNSFFVDANDNKNRYVSFVVRIFEDKFTVTLMSELLEDDLTSGSVYLKNYEYDFEKALNWAVGYLESQYDFFVNINL